MALVSLVYASSATRPFAAAGLAELLARSRENNARLGVTGMLLHKDGNFMQVLEGEAEAVRRLFDRIGRDPRHTGLIVLRHEERQEREFAEWSMAFQNLDLPEARALPGYSEFLNTPLTGREFAEAPSLCRKLLLTFKRNLGPRGTP